jgi:hypothetical protein
MPRGIHMKAKWEDPEYRASQQPKIVKNAKIGGLKRVKPKIAVTCIICNNVFYVNEYRFTHQNPNCCSKECQKKYQSLMIRGETHPQWKGGRRKHKAGYILCYAPDHPHAGTNNAVFEHRLVVEKTLGRYLLPDEHVHHINGIKNDNRPENLEVLSNAEHHIRHTTNGRWSTTSDACIECGTTSRKHWGHGLCSTCLVRKNRRARLALNLLEV